jgi:hypothetical protein
MEREHRPQFAGGLRAPVSSTDAGPAPSGDHALLDLDELLEEELLPRQDAVYAPPREPPRETDHRTLHLRRVVIAPEADHRRQRTLLLRRAAPELAGPDEQARRAARRKNAANDGPSVTTLLLAVAAGALLGAVAWLYVMGATRNLPIANLRQLAQAALPPEAAAQVVEAVEGKQLRTDVAVLQAGAAVPQGAVLQAGAAVPQGAVPQLGAALQPGVALPLPAPQQAAAVLQPGAALPQVAGRNAPDPVAQPEAVGVGVPRAASLQPASLQGAVPRVAVAQPPPSAVPQPGAISQPSAVPPAVKAAAATPAGRGGATARPSMVNSVKNSKQRPAAASTPASRGTQKSWLGNDEPAAWVK